ncbi:MAG: T9SS type A sorting domain-containing protein [Burkholderiales bacterium]|nr:T9SS type A sorting domain-containing protein [Bacteroidia bacterium]
MVKKYFLLIVTLIILRSLGLSQCINVTAFGMATVNGCTSGTISTCNYASEYGEIIFNSVGTYTFNSSVGTDFLTLTTAANAIIASGPAPLLVTIPSTGGYRLHVNTDASCGTQSTCRITTYSCASTTSVGCINSSPFGSATISSCASGTITTCNWAIEYSELTFSTAGSFTFYSSVPTDYFTFTDVSNNVIAYGVQPLTATIPTTGLYRLHLNSDALCGTDQTCRTTSYGCSMPCSGTPTAGTALASYTNLCSATAVNFSLPGSTSATGITYQWQSSPNGSTWTNITGALTINYSQVVNATGYFRCIVACGSFTSASSPAMVTMGGTTVGGTAVASGLAPCGGGTITYSLSGATVAFGLSYQWQSSPNGSVWTNIVGKTASATTEFVPTSTYFRCILMCGFSATVASLPVLTTVSSGAVSYANVPYVQTFDNTWQNGCDIRELPDNLYWKSKPATGNESWRRQNDGIAASWTNASIGVVVPASGIGCANFHSFGANNNDKGAMDFYVNMNQNGKYVLSFYYLNVSGSDNLDVMLSTDAGSSFSIKGAYTTQTIWTKKVIYFNAPNSPTCVIRLRGTSDNGNDDIGVDSLSLKLVCLNPAITAASSASTICSGASLTLTATGATSYTWMPTSLHNSSIVVTPTVNTHYVVTGSNDGLCFPSAGVSVSVTICNGIEELYGSQISVFPNPANGLITVLLPKEVTTAYFEITDPVGKLISKEELTQKHNMIDITELANGIYLYKILQKATTISVGKIIKQ